MRLIDADALIEFWEADFTEEERSKLHIPLNVAIENLRDAPTVKPIKVGDVCKECWRDGGNVVEVVRCKDCKFSKPFNEVWTLPKRNTIVCRMFRNEEVGYDFFCANGERRSE